MALGVAAGAVLLARRPATPNRSFGFQRAEILAALVNAVSLIVIAIIVFVGAARRFADPPDVPGGWLIAVASVGLLINLIGAVAVFRPGGHDLNLRAAYIHLVGDALGSIGVIVTGIVIVTTGWRYADPLVGVLIGIFLVVSSWGVLRDSTLVLLEATPRAWTPRISAARSRPSRASSRCTTSTSGRSRAASRPSRRTCSCGRETTATASAGRPSACWRERFAITHTTLQVDHEHAPGCSRSHRPRAA